MEASKEPFDRADEFVRPFCPGRYPYAVCDSVTHKPGEVNYNDYSFYKRTLSTTGFSADYQGRGYSINSRTAFQYISDHQGIDQDFSPKSIYFARQDMKAEKCFPKTEHQIKRLPDATNGCSVPSVSGRG